LDGACNMIKAAKALAGNPKEPAVWQQLAEHTKSVSDSVRQLVHAIR
jgi:talin